MGKIFSFLTYVVLIGALVASVSQIWHLQEKNDALKKENKSLKRDTVEWKDNYLGLQTQMNAREAEGIERTNKLEKLILSKQQVYKEIQDTLKPAFEHILSNEKVTQKTIDNLQEKIVGQISTLVGAEQEKYNELSKKLNEKVVALNRENSQLETNLKNLSSDLEKILSDKLIARKEMQSAEAKIRSFNKETARLESRIEQKKAEIKQLRSDLRQKDKEILNLDSKNRMISKSLSSYVVLQQRTSDYARELGDNFLKAVKKEHLVRNAGSALKDIVTLNWFKNLNYDEEVKKINQGFASLEEDKALIDSQYAPAP